MSGFVIRKCYPEHVLLIDVVQPQQIERVNIALSQGAVAAQGESYSGWVDNRCVWAGGVFEKWADVGFGWALFGKGSYAHIAAITERSRQTIHNAPYKRVEVTVDPGYKAGERWAKALGLTLEAANLRCYGPGGRDMALYSYVRGGS